MDLDPKILTLVPLVTALVQAVKQLPGLKDKGHLIPWVSLGIGIALVAAYQAAWGASGLSPQQIVATDLIAGAIVGLSGAGLYSVAVSPVVDRLAK